MKRSFLLLAALAASGCAGTRSASPRSARTLKVLTLNIQLDAANGRLPGIVELIKRSGADVAGLQEVGASGPEIAKRLGFHYERFDEDTAVVSRYELTKGPGPSAVKVRLPDGGEVVFVDLHLYYKPYQPFQLLGIPYENGRFIKTEAEAIAEARAARIAKVEETLADVSQAATEDAAIVLVGDFNEPSFLDWTDRAAAIKRHPVKVAWPATKAFADGGFKDSYRALFPDEMAKPGYTWTPGLDLNNPKDHADRIDFVLYRGSGLRPASAAIVGEDLIHADIAVVPYPTDHRGVLTAFELTKP